MNTQRVDGIIEALLYPSEGDEPIGGDNPQHPRFKWTPPSSGPIKPTKPGATTKGPFKGKIPPTHAEPEQVPIDFKNPGELEDREGSLSINQLLGNSRFANKADLDAATMRMRGKLGPAGAERWAANYGKAEFEAAALKLVNSLLEKDAEKEAKKFEKDSKNLEKKTKSQVSTWMKELGKKGKKA